MEINTGIEHVVEIANNVYAYEEETDLKNLKKTQNYVYYQNCMLKYNNKFEILAMDDETLVVKNAINETVLQNCDDRKITLNKNYLISVYNCKITIKEYVLQNKIEIVKEKYYIPVNNANNTFEKEINFKKIVLENFENIKEIKELKYHRNVSYAISTFFFVSIVIILVILYLRKNNNKIKIINKIEKKSEDVELEAIKEKYGLKSNKP